MATTTNYLDRMLNPFTECLTPEVAERLVSLRVDPETQARIDVLADKCTEGELTDDERDEYETYVRTGNLLAILQAKAHGLLANQPGLKLSSSATQVCVECERLLPERNVN